MRGEVLTMNFIPSLILILIVPLGSIAQTVNSAASFIQNRPGKSAMTKDEVLQMATLIMAIKRDWSMIDEDPEADFLIFVNEDRETLEFFPKKTLPKRMEELGLLVNKDGTKVPVREPYIHYQGNINTDTVEQITTPGGIFYNYEITAKGKEFLANAPKTLGRPLPPLKIASWESESRHSWTKPIKVVKYDHEALQKIRDNFARIAQNQVEILFAPANADKPESELPEGFSCGPNLWAKIETEAIKNGMHPGALKVVYSYWRDTGDSGSNTYDRPEKGISSRPQVSLFRKTLFQVFPLAGTPSIRKLTEQESARYQDLQDRALGMSPFFMRSAAFFVEYDKLRFLVKVRNESTEDFMNISPKVSLVELVER